MKCVICNGPNIELKTVEEEIRWGNNILLVPMEVLVCSNCGERYYDKKAMRKIEETRSKLQKHDFKVHEVGKIFKEHTA